MYSVSTICMTDVVTVVWLLRFVLSLLLLFCRNCFRKRSCCCSNFFCCCRRRYIHHWFPYCCWYCFWRVVEVVGFVQSVAALLEVTEVDACLFGIALTYKVRVIDKKTVMTRTEYREHFGMMALECSYLTTLLLWITSQFRIEGKLSEHRFSTSIAFMTSIAMILRWIQTI